MTSVRSWGPVDDTVPEMTIIFQGQRSVDDNAGKWSSWADVDMLIAHKLIKQGGRHHPSERMPTATESDRHDYVVGDIGV